MPWASRPTPASPPQVELPLIGLDLNSTRARAVTASLGQSRVLLLEGARENLPLYVSLQGRQMQVGQTGYALCRRSPHLVCLDFLASIGEQRLWRGGKHRVDAMRATASVLERLQAAFGKTRGVVLALPGYLSFGQAHHFKALCEKARIPYLGFLKSPLALALAAHAKSPWTGPALLVDVDDHALTASLLLADGDQVWIQTAQYWPQWNLRVWKVRMLDGIAERCVVQSRRDPRDSPLAEQALFEQLDEAMEAGSRGKLVELLIQTSHWYHHQLLQPEEMAKFSKKMVESAVSSIRSMVEGGAWNGTRFIFMTQAAARLPGLAAALSPLAGEAITAKEVDSDSEDFGDDLVDAGIDTGMVSVLGEDEAAKSAQETAARMHAGLLAAGPYDQSIPLPRDNSVPLTAPIKKKTFRILSPEG